MSNTVNPDLEFDPADLAAASGIIDDNGELEFDPADIAAAAGDTEEAESDELEFDPADLEAASVDEEESSISRFMESAKTGARETIAAHSVNQPAQPADMVEMAGHAAGSIGIDLAAGAASAKAGAIAGSFFGPIGSAVGGIAALIGYGVYSAVGQETLAEKRGAEFSEARAATRAILNVNPLLRYGGKVSQHMLKNAPKMAQMAKKTEQIGPRMGRLAAQVSGEAGVVASESADLGHDPMEDGAITGSVSLIMHGLAFKSGKNIDLLTSKDISNTISPSGYSAASRAAERMSNEMETNPDKFKLDYNAAVSGKMDLDFARNVNGPRGGLTQGDEKRIINQAAMYLEEAGPERAQGFYQDWRYSQLFLDESVTVANERRRDLKKAMIDSGNKAAADELEIVDIGTIKRRLLDGQHIGQHADNLQSGLGITEAINNVSHASGIANTAINSIYDKVDVARKLRKKAKISETEITDLRLWKSGEDRSATVKKSISRFLDQNGNISPKLDDVMDAHEDVMNTMFSAIRTYGMGTTSKDFYVPRYTVSGAQRDMYIADSVTEILDLADKIPKKNISRWSKADLKNKVDDPDKLRAKIKDIRYMAKISNFGAVTTSNLPEFLRHLKNPDTVRKIDQKLVGAAMQREAKGPQFSEFFREKDFDVMVSRYINTQVKPAIMSESLWEIKKLANITNSIGMTETSAWLENMRKDMMGSKPRYSWRVETQNQLNQWKKKAEIGMARNQDKIVKYWGYRTGKMALDFASGGWQASMYPAVLGLNTAAALRNLTQPILQNAPMLGGQYGVELTIRSYTSNPMRHVERMRRDGTLAEHAPQLEAETILRGANRKINNFLMWGFSASDKTNRIVSYNMGHLLAKDLVAGNPQALQALKNSGAGVMSSLEKRGFTSMEAMKENLDEVGDIIGKSILARTQFHYSQEQKAELARDLGPMLTMFSKWPVSMSSEVSTINKENPKIMQKLKRYNERFIMPTVLLWSANEMLPDDSEIKNTMGELYSMSPVLSVFDLSLDGNPTIQSVKAIQEAANRAERFGPESLKSSLKNLARHALKTGVPTPAVSAVINEFGDRRRPWNSRTNKPLSKDIVDSLFGE